MFFGKGGPGGPGGYPGKGGSAQHDTDTTKFYKLLELEKSASTADVKKAYKRLAMVNHPDKGGDPEKFKELTCAYEVLNDPEKRAHYDQYGEDGDWTPSDPGDIFNMFFGGGSPGGKGRGGRKKTKDIVHPLSVSLEQLYNGAKRKLAVHREVLDKKQGVQSCDSCGGRGQKSEMLRLGPVAQQVMRPCSNCGGQGKTFKTRREREVLEVFVEKGQSQGQKITFYGKADEHPDADPGDVVFILQEQEHKDFNRKGSDLFVMREVSLLEALTGFAMVLEHLDGRKLLVKTQPGEVVQPLAEGTGLKAVKGEGMPTYKSPFVFGNLFIILTIRFPEEISPNIVPQLKKILPGPSDAEIVDEDDPNVEVAYIEDMDPVESQKANASHYCGEAYEEDDEGGFPGGPRVGMGCPHQ